MSPKTEVLQWVRPPRQARSQETLDRILDVAEALITEKGFEEVPISEIVRRAKSSVGSFYNRFKDKHGLLHALYERFYEEAVATADQALDPARWEGATLAEVVHSVIAFLVRIHRERAGLLGAFVVHASTSLEFRERRLQLTRHVQEAFTPLVEERREEFGRPDPTRASHFGLITVISTIQECVLFGMQPYPGGEISDDGLADELSSSFLAYARFS